MRCPRLIVWLFIIVLSAEVAGCSWLKINPTPEQLGQGSIDCTESNEAPGWDVFFASIFGLGSLASLAVTIWQVIWLAENPDSVHGLCGEARCMGLLAIPALLVSLSPTVTFGYSAKYGFEQTARCREIRGIQLVTKSPSALVWIHSNPGGIEFTKSLVTVEQYRACVKAGPCSAPKASSADKNCNWERAKRDMHPMNCVDWNQAKTFCEWVGGRLPTEEEWYEEASNGGKFVYPWGDDAISCDYAVMKSGGNGCGENSTWPVCSKPAGNSVSGLCDMSGNVWEWTSSSDGPDRMLRGGSWVNDNPEHLKASYRSKFDPSRWNNGIGFRCVRPSTAPPNQSPQAISHPEAAPSQNSNNPEPK